MQSPPAHATVFPLRLKVRASITAGQCSVRVQNLTEHRGLALAAEPIHRYDFFLGGWMGLSNPHMAFELLKGQPDGTGVATLNIPILPEKDTDTFKIGTYIADPDTKMNRHLASGFHTLGWLADAIDGVNSFDNAKTSLLLTDNYSANRVLLHFANDGTDVAQLRKLLAQLKPSAMRRTDQLNAQVNAMATGIHDMIEKVSCVDMKNGGPSFIQNICFTQSAGCAINYPLLNMTYDCPRHRTPVPMLAYMALATLHYTGLSAAAALALPDDAFVHKFVIPMCTSFTVCPDSCIYSGDMTLDTCGNLQQPTEDFAMVLSQHYYGSVKDAYQRLDKDLGSLTPAQLRAHIKTLRAAPRQNAQGHFLIEDDCETLSGMIKSIEGGIHLGAQVLAGGSDAKLGEMLWESTRDLPNLASVPRGDFDDCAKLLGRYGRLKANAAKGVTPSAQIGQSVISAKGASFNIGTSELNGHSCTVAQVLDAEGKASYFIGEGTTNMQMRDLPAACPKKVSLVMSNGPRTYDTAEALTIIGQNLGELTTAGKGKTRAAQIIPCSFDGKDPYTACPFYMASFFMGLELGRNIPAIIPLDARNMLGKKGGATLAGEAGHMQPLFGAPVAGLACDAIKAIPVDLGAVMGQEKADEFLGGLRARNLESYPPRASQATLKHLMSRWGDLPPLRRESLDDGRHWMLSNAESFKCADTLRAVGEFKARLATEFNSLQAKDPKDDGVRMHVGQHMLSVVTHFRVPLPSTEKWGLSCAHNMRLAVKAMPFETTHQQIGAEMVGLESGVKRGLTLS